MSKKTQIGSLRDVVIKNEGVDLDVVTEGFLSLSDILVKNLPAGFESKLVIKQLLRTMETAVNIIERAKVKKD